MDRRELYKKLIPIFGIESIIVIIIGIIFGRPFVKIILAIIVSGVLVFSFPYFMSKAKHVESEKPDTPSKKMKEPK